MEDIFRAQELKINDYVLNIISCGPSIEEEIVNFMSKAITEYTRMINGKLEEYSKIDYITNREEKIQFKSRLKYSYRLLELCTNLLHIMNEQKRLNIGMETQIEFIEEHIMNFEILLKEKYYPSALEELISFHNVDFRNQLEKDLAGKMDKKF